MLRSGPIVLGALFASMVALGLSGCGGPEKVEAPPSPAAGTVERSREAPGVPAGAIDDKTLLDSGFLPLWTKQATEGAFHSAYLLPEGIFAIARPKTGSNFWRLIRYNLEDGLPLWFYELEEPLRYPPVPYHYATTAEGRQPDELFILQKDVVRCLTLQDGAEMWRIQLPFSVSCAPIVDERQYYIGSLDKRIYAMAKKKPYPVWPYITGGEIKSPGTIGSSGQLYFASTDKSIFRLEPANGWTPGRSWSFGTGGRILGSPVFFSRWVYVGSTDYKLYCFEVDGTRAWDFPTESPIYEAPVVMSLRPEKPLVFCRSRDERRNNEKDILWVLGATNGEKLWHRERVERVVALGRRAVYLIPEAQPGEPRKIVAVDALKGDDLTSLSVKSFDIIPTNDAEHGTNPKLRGVIFLISKTGFMQAIREKL